MARLKPIAPRPVLSLEMQLFSVSKQNLKSEPEETFFRQDVDELVAAQEGAFAKAGVDVSGSPALKFLQTREKEEAGARNIKENTRRRVRAARIRARQAQDQADLLSGPFGQFIQPLGTFAAGAGRAAASA